MMVEEIETKDEAAWDRFVLEEAGGTLFHTIGWKRLVQSHCRYRPLYLAARSSEGIEGVLPLFLVSHRGFGRKLVSVPHAVLGGVCARSEQAAECLVQRAVEETRRLKCDYLELRGLSEHPGEWVVDRRYAAFHLRLDPDPDRVWRGMRKSHRRAVAKAQTRGLAVELDSDGIRRFSSFYARDQRNFGTPTLGRSWIHDLVSIFPEYHSIARVVFDDKPIAQFLVRRFRGIVSEVVGNDDPRFREWNPNSLLEWALIQDACLKGYKIYDFGRSLLESGSSLFKIGWGAEPLPLVYQFFRNGSVRLPDTSQTNPKRQRLARTWKRLPMPLADAIGPLVRRRFP